MEHGKRHRRKKKRIRMRIWTIQPEAVYEALREQKVLYTDISKSPLYHMEDVGVMDNPFQKGYDWFARRMEEKTGKPEGRPTPGGPGTGGTGSTKSPTCGKPGTRGRGNGAYAWSWKSPMTRQS